MFWASKETSKKLEKVLCVVDRLFMKQLIIVLMKNFFDGAPSMKSLNGVCGVFLWRMVGVETIILF